MPIKCDKMEIKSTNWRLFFTHSWLWGGCQSKNFNTSQCEECDKRFYCFTHIYRPPFECPNVRHAYDGIDLCDLNDKKACLRETGDDCDIYEECLAEYNAESY